MENWSHYYAFGMRMPELFGDSPFGGWGAYRYGFNGMEKDGAFSGDSYDFGARIYDSRIARWSKIDPQWKEFASHSPYAYAFNNPNIWIDDEGEVPILAWLVKYAAQFGVGVGTDITLQVVASYLFDGKSLSDAFYNVNFSQALWSGGENIIGNKHGKALISGFNDLTNYYWNTKNPTTNGAFRAFLMGGASAYIGDWITKFGAKKVAKGLEKLGIGYKTIRQYTGFDILKNNFNKQLKSALKIKNRGKLDPQTGSFFEDFGVESRDGLITINGNPLTTTGTHSEVRLVDFVITESGELKIGKGHDYLSKNSDYVYGAGQLRVKNGKITEINNNTGHFTTSEDELNSMASLLKALGVTSNDVKITIKVPDSKNPRFRK